MGICVRSGIQMKNIRGARGERRSRIGSFAFSRDRTSSVDFDIDYPLSITP